MNKTSGIHSKPYLMKKLVEYSRYIHTNGKNNIKPRGFILNYSNKCNFNCKHCFTRSSQNDICDQVLTLDDVQRLGNEADALGVYEVDIQGGEPLLNKDLFNILGKLNTERFYVYITTNGWLMTDRLANDLASAGVDRVTVSIDSFIPEEHDEFRGVKGAYSRAMQALEHVKTAGMKPYINVVVGAYNARSQSLDDFCNFAKSKQYGIVFTMATPSGNWQGNFEIMANDEDSKAMEALRKKHKIIIRDLWDYTDLKHEKISGCPAVNLFYVNPKGDVLPCPYIHTSLGNIREKSLADILATGFRIKHFRNYSPICLAGENKDFAQKFMTKKMSILEPIPAHENFSPSEWLEA